MGNRTQPKGQRRLFWASTEAQPGCRGRGDDFALGEEKFKVGLTKYGFGGRERKGNSSCKESFRDEQAKPQVLVCVGGGEGGGERKVETGFAGQTVEVQWLDSNCEEAG